MQKRKFAYQHIEYKKTMSGPKFGTRVGSLVWVAAKIWIIL